MVRTKMLDQMVLTWESIATLARAVIHRTVTEDGVVHAGLVALKIRKSSEGLVTAGSVASKGLAWSEILLVTTEGTRSRVQELIGGGGRTYLVADGVSGPESSLMLIVG